MLGNILFRVEFGSKKPTKKSTPSLNVDGQVQDSPLQKLGLVKLLLVFFFKKPARQSLSHSLVISICHVTQ